MIDFPLKAEVYCSDGHAGRCTYIIAQPENDEITHLVVQSIRPPFSQYVVPVNQVENASGKQIQLKCSRGDLYQMEPFEYEEYVETELPDYIVWSDVRPIPGMTTEPVNTFIRVKRRNIPQGEALLHRGAVVHATDGYVSKVDELSVDPNTMQVTHLVFTVRHIFDAGEVTIPISEIDHVDEDTIYLKLDRQSVAALATTSIQP